MITKKQLIDSFEHECAIIKHLFLKLTPEQLSFAPAPGMRTTLQLMRYLVACGVAPLKGAVHGDFAMMTQGFADSSKLEANEIVAAIDQQSWDIRETLTAVPDADFANRDVTFPWGAHDKLAMALINGPLKFLAAYRMQLFLYAKLSGTQGLTTANCWAGIDMPMMGAPVSDSAVAN